MFTSKFPYEGTNSKTDSGHFISMTPFPEQWHVTNKSGDAAIYGYILSTFSPGFVDVQFFVRFFKHWYYL